MAFITKKQLKRWHSQGYRAYEAGWCHVTDGSEPVGTANTLITEAMMMAGRKDAEAARKKWGYYVTPPAVLPLDRWLEVIALASRPNRWGVL